MPPNGDPDDPDEPEAPDEPSEPEKPSKPDEPDKPKVDCKPFAVDLLNAEQAEKEALARKHKANAEFEKWRGEIDRLKSERTDLLYELALELALPIAKIRAIYKSLKGERPQIASILIRLFQIDDDLTKARKNTDAALKSRKIREDTAEEATEEAARIRRKLEKAGC